MRTLCLFFTILIYLSSTVYCGTIDPNIPDTKYLNYGAQHKCVALIEGKSEDQKNYRASCVIIDKYWVITAAHVVMATTDNYIFFQDKKIPINIVAYHKDYDPDIFGMHDIALCRLSAPVNLDFYPELYADSDEVGKVSSQAGFGFTGNFNTGAYKYDDKIRAGSNVVDSVDKNLLVCSNTGRKSSLEFLISSGDSGGGLFIDKKLAGIHSCIWSEDGKLDSDYGDFSGHTRISVYTEWIVNTMKSIQKEHPQ